MHTDGNKRGSQFILTASLNFMFKETRNLVIIASPCGELYFTHTQLLSLVYADLGSYTSITPPHPKKNWDLENLGTLSSYISPNLHEVFSNC